MDPTTTYQRTQELASAIKALNPELDKMSKFFLKGIFSEDNYNFCKYSGDDWRRNTFGDALVRLRQFTEQNFQLIGTMGLLAVARYIFELSVWLHLFNKDKSYGLLYYFFLMDTKLRFYKDTLEHLKREVSLLRDIEKKDKDSSAMTIKKIISDKNITSVKVKELFTNSIGKIDEEASRKFSLYLDDAKFNGYGYQAHLVENRVIPDIKKIIDDLEKEINSFNNSFSKKLKKLLPNWAAGMISSKRFQWRKTAGEVGLLTEYDYIYCYASKLLHATPASLTTDKKDLEPNEVYLFMRYIYSKLHEILDLSKKQPEILMKTDVEQSH